MTFNQCRDHGHGMFMVHKGARVEHPPTSGKLRLHTMVSAAGLSGFSRTQCHRFMHSCLQLKTLEISVNDEPRYPCIHLVHEC